MTLRAINAGYAIQGEQLVEDVSLTVEPGRMSALLGPNGAGKSTLLRMLSAELSPSSGAIQLQERGINDWTSRERAQRVGVLPQASELKFPYPVLDVVLLGRLPHHDLHTTNERIAWECLERVEATHLASRIYSTLSGGERQRVHLARVLTQIYSNSDSPRYLLLDEPTSALDLAHQHVVLRLAKELTAEGVGVLAILHDINQAALYADEISVLCRGAIVRNGTPAEVLTTQCVQNVYGLDSTIICHPVTGCPFLIPHPMKPGAVPPNTIQSTAI